MPTDNSTMNLAKQADKDEFYTLPEDIEKECERHISQFKDKVVYCNCDNPSTSNFFAYFALNFKRFGLKKLICSHHSFDVFRELDLFSNQQPLTFQEKAHKVILNSPLPDNLDTYDKILSFMKEDMNSTSHKYVQSLDGDGDFKSQECLSLLNMSDIVVTNPPFSLLGEFIPFVLSHNKELLALGNINALKYKKVFPYIKSGQLRFGKSSFNSGMYFKVPENYGYSNVYKFKKDINGVSVLRVSSICWYSTLEQEEPPYIPLSCFYNEKDYPHYSDYNAIEVGNAVNIPKDYFEVMGVPISFINKLNYNQFEVVGCCNNPKLDNKELYARLMIRRKQ